MLLNNFQYLNKIMKFFLASDPGKDNPLPPRVHFSTLAQKIREKVFQHYLTYVMAIVFFRKKFNYFYYFSHYLCCKLLFRDEQYVSHFDKDFNLISISSIDYNIRRERKSTLPYINENHFETRKQDRLKSKCIRTRS